MHEWRHLGSAVQLKQRHESNSIDLCDQLKNLPDDVISRLRIRRKRESGRPEVQCFIDDMNNFFKHRFDRTSPRIQLPFVKNNIVNLMKLDQSAFIKTSIPDNFVQNFEVALCYWLENIRNTPQFEVFRHLLGLELLEDVSNRSTTTNVSNHIKAGRLRFAAIQINSTTDDADGYKSAIILRQHWEKYIRDMVSQFPEQLRNYIILTTSDKEAFSLWRWFTVKQTMVNEVKMLVLVGWATLLLGLMVATTNSALGFITIAIAMSVSAAVASTLWYCGLRLGVMECIMLTVVVGLSARSAIRLTLLYAHAQTESRDMRLRDALNCVIRSTLYSTVGTTGGAICMFYFAADSISPFWRQVSIFVGTISVYSAFCVLFFQASLLAGIGPEGPAVAASVFARCSEKYCT